MIIKTFELSKIKLNKNNILLLYGKNEGHKIEAIDSLIRNKNNISHYDEKEILDNQNNFLENIFSQSLFEREKTIIIKRATDKFVKVIDEIYSKNLEDTIIIINADNLEKKSKLRSLF